MCALAREDWNANPERAVETRKRQPEQRQEVQDFELH